MNEGNGAGGDDDSADRQIEDLQRKWVTLTFPLDRQGL